MENEREPEVIRERMNQTRNNLTHKVEAVETMVANTVKSTTDAVTETVEAVKDTVETSVSNVKEAVSDTIEGVKHVFDFNAHFRNHPWLMLAGSVGAGFLVGKLVGRAERSASVAGTVAGTVAGAVSGYTNGHADRADSGDWRNVSAPSAPRTEKPQRSSGGLIQSLLEKIGPAADRIKEMGIGYSMGLLEELVKKAVPDQLKDGVHDVVASLNSSLGGRPLSEFHSGNAVSSAAG